MFVNWVRVYTYMYFEILYHNPKILREMMALNTLYGVKKIGEKAGKMPIHCTLLQDGQETEGKNLNTVRRFALVSINPCIDPIKRQQLYSTIYRQFKKFQAMPTCIFPFFFARYQANESETIDNATLIKSYMLPKQKNDIWF